MFSKYGSYWLASFFAFWFLGYIFNINVIIKYINPYYTSILLLIGFIFHQSYNIFIKKYKYEFSFLLIHTITHSLPLILSYYLIKNKHKYALINLLIIMILYIIYMNYIDRNIYHTYFIYKPPLNWNEYFKLAFVRNPYDRCISFYFYHKSPQYKFRIGIKEAKKPYKEWLIKQLSSQQNMVAIPQSTYINRPLDFIGRYENLENDYQYFIKKIGGEKELPHYNKSIDHESWEHYYDDELKEIVSKHFKDDFDLFGYAI